MPQLKYWDVTQAAYIPLQIGNPPAYPNLPPTLAAGATFTTYTDAAGDLWIAKGGVYSGAWKRPRDVLGGRWSRTAALTLAGATNTAIPLDTTQRDPFGMLTTAAPVGAINLPLAGLYLVTINMQIGINAVPQEYLTYITSGGNTLAYGTDAKIGAGAATSDPLTSQLQDVISVTAGTTVVVQGLNPSANAVSLRQLAPSQAYCAVQYLGTG
jgi:hypothetical protein